VAPTGPQAGRVTGLLGAYLLLVQVALMARIPWLERRIGPDWLARASGVAALPPGQGPP
jgi:hypothetical protein